MEQKMGVKEKIMSHLENFKTIYELEKREDVTPDELMNVIKKCREIDESLISPETIKELEEVIIPSLNSVFGKEVAFYKCKAILRTLNLNMLTKIRVNIEEFSSTLKEIKNKNIILDNLYDVLKKYMDRVTQIKSDVNISFENKEKFLRACQSCIHRHYRGMLNLNNSAIKLGKVVHKIMHNSFDEGGPRKGENIEKEKSLNDYLGMLKYYSDRDVLRKTNLDLIKNFNSEAIIQELAQLPKLPEYDLDSMLQFIVMAGNGVEDNSNGDDAQGNAIVWTTIVNEMNGVYQQGLEIFNKNIKPRLGMIGDNESWEMGSIVEKIEELYKINDDSDDILKYVCLLNGMIDGYDIYIKLELYDILSFITGTEYLTFMFIITYMVYETYKSENLAGE